MSTLFPNKPHRYPWVKEYAADLCRRKGWQVGDVFLTTWPDGDQRRSKIIYIADQNVILHWQDRKSSTSEWGEMHEIAYDTDEAFELFEKDLDLGKRIETP